MPSLFTKTVPLVLTGVALLACLPAPASAREVMERFDFDLSGGYRLDQLDWNIAGDLAGHNPNVISELSWKNLKSKQVAARAKMIMANDRLPFGGLVRLGASYGEIYSGTVRDSDYGGDDRSREFSRSTSRGDSGDLWDASLGAGMVFANRSRTFSLAPLLGVSQRQQNLVMEEGNQTLTNLANLPSNVKDSPPPLGPIYGLHSTYETKWRTGWLGLDLDFLPWPYVDLHGAVELHAGKYEAEADWNLRGDFAHPRSFRQTSDTVGGLVATVGLRAGHPNLLLSVDYSYQKWRAKDGIDRTYSFDETYSDTKLNEVNWEASSVTAGVTVRF